MLKLNLKKFRKNTDIGFNVGTDLIITPETPFGYKEAYRALFTNVLYLPIESRCKTIGLTSAISSEGKTTVSANLAITTALNSPESKVLLIDADMRKTSLTKLMLAGNDYVHGLSEFLVGIDKEPNIVSTEYQSLSIFPAGTPNVNTPGLLSSSKFALLMKQLKEEYDYIFIDTPPVGIVADALLLNEFTDGYIMVSRADYSDVSSISDSLTSITAVNAKVFGFVLTADNAKKSANLKYDRYSSYSNN